MPRSMRASPSGFRPGGPNVLPPGAPAEHPASYEFGLARSATRLGVKVQSADRVFGFEIAAFHIDWQDIQLLRRPTAASTSTRNGGGAKSDGVEFTATAAPVTGSRPVAQRRLHQRPPDRPTPLIGGLDGDKLPFTPEFTVSLNGDYSFAVGDGAEAHVGGSLRYLSEQSASFDEDYRAGQRRPARDRRLRGGRPRRRGRLRPVRPRALRQEPDRQLGPALRPPGPTCSAPSRSTRPARSARA